MSQPNIVLLTVDCFRYDRCGFNGHSRPVTPNLDRLATESHVFDNAYATGPQTVESFPGIFAGLHSHEVTHVEDNINWKAVPASSETLATFLSDQGYSTAATLTNAFVTEDQNYDRGFNEFENLESGDIETDDDGGSVGGDLLGSVTSSVESRLQKQETVRNPYMLLFTAYQYRRLLSGWPSPHAEDVLDRFLDTIDDLETPFFGWSHLMDLHLPIHPKIVDGEVSGGVSRFEHFVSEGARAGDIRSRTADDVYDGALAYVDRQIGRFLEALGRRNLLEDTIVVVTGDHGEALYDRGIYGHHVHYMYDELLRVPMLVRTPSMESERISAPFSLAWLHELFAEVLGIETGDFPPSSGRESVFNSTGGNPVVSDAISDAGHSVAVRGDGYKYVTYFGAEPPGDQYEVLEDTTFRIEGDRGERAALDGVEGPAPLRDEAQRIRTVPADLRSIEHGVSKDVREQLDELGYRM